MIHEERFRLATHLTMLFVFIFFLAATASAEWKEKVLYSFQGIPDGSLPVGAVVFDKAGNLYGATTEGGSSSCISVAQCGTVYQLAPPAKTGDPWTETVLHIFKGNASKDGASPAGGLVIDSAGNLYGTTAYGGTGNCVVLGTLMGCGTVYEMSPPQQKGGPWTETVLYSFPTPKQGFLPQGDLVFDSAGNLYGATEFGGGFGTTCNPFYRYCGAVFELSPPKTRGGKWAEQVLHGFKSGTDGANPNGGLVLDSKGDVYGTTFGGGNESGECGSGGCGTAFELKPPIKTGGAWAEKVLHRFNYNTSDASNPMAGLVIDRKGNLCGTSMSGGPGPGGTVFRLSPSPKKPRAWTETILHGFNGNEGGYDPEGALIFDVSGNLYGTTNVGSGGSLQGSVFRLKPPMRNEGAWTLDTLHGFRGAPDGEFPSASLVFDNSGNLYGTTQGGGTGTGCSGYCGTVFEVSQ
jgi:hypothetical protein